MRSAQFTLVQVGMQTLLIQLSLKRCSSGAFSKGHVRWRIGWRREVSQAHEVDASSASSSASKQPGALVSNGCDFGVQVSGHTAMASHDANLMVMCYPTAHAQDT
jgi:hypothetical protein